MPCVLPKPYQLNTRPADPNELQLPQAITEQGCWPWCSSSIQQHFERIQYVMQVEAVNQRFHDRANHLTTEVFENAEEALIWCSGKDLLAGLSAQALESLEMANAGQLRAVLRDWVRQNPEQATTMFPEWSNLIDQLRS